MKYLQLDQARGSFFEYSGSEKEGFTKFESSTGKVSYRNYFDKGIDGVLESVSLADGRFGKQIQLCIKNEDELHMFQVDVYDQKDHVSTFAEELIKFIPKFEKGMDISFNSYNFTPEGETFSRRGFSIKTEGEKLDRALTNSYYAKEDGKLVEGDIPAVKWVEKLGKKKPSPASLEEKDDFLLGVLEKETERLKFVPNSEYAKSNTPIENKKDTKKEEEDSLPF